MEFVCMNLKSQVRNFYVILVVVILITVKYKDKQVVYTNNELRHICKSVALCKYLAKASDTNHQI